MCGEPSVAVVCGMTPCENTPQWAMPMEASGEYRGVILVVATNEKGRYETLQSKKQLLRKESLEGHNVGSSPHHK